VFFAGGAGSDESQGAAQLTYQEPDTLTASQRRIFQKALVGHSKVVRNAG
jgi:hypothetical protein